MEKEPKSIKISCDAYNAIQQIVADNPDKYKGRGMLGAVDDIVLHRFTSVGRGKNTHKKSVDKK